MSGIPEYCGNHSRKLDRDFRSCGKRLQPVTGPNFPRLVADRWMGRPITTSIFTASPIGIGARHPGNDHRFSPDISSYVRLAVG